MPLSGSRPSSTSAARGARPLAKAATPLEAEYVAAQIRLGYQLHGVLTGEAIAKAIGYKIIMVDELFGEVEGSAKKSTQEIRLLKTLSPPARSQVAGHETGELLVPEILDPLQHETFCHWVAGALTKPPALFKKSLKLHGLDLDALSLIWWNSTREAIARRIPQVMGGVRSRFWSWHKALWSEVHPTAQLDRTALKLEEETLARAYYRSRGRAYQQRGRWRCWAYRTNDLPTYRGLTVLQRIDHHRDHWEPVAEETATSAA